ncbi:MAG: hypothetical protein ACQEW2_24075, partial [Bacillota bacterium]|uniref:hypothetical protein n=1 Tax=Cytobacillus firmus TaxID=1399 RepID=UPI001C3F466E
EKPVLRVRTSGNFGHKKLKSNVQSQNPDLLKGNGTCNLKKYVSTRLLRVIKRGQRITNMLQIRKDSH